MVVKTCCSYCKVLSCIVRYSTVQEWTETQVARNEMNKDQAVGQVKDNFNAFSNEIQQQQERIYWGITSRQEEPSQKRLSLEEKIFNVRIFEYDVAKKNDHQPDGR